MVQCQPDHSRHNFQDMNWVWENFLIHLRVELQQSWAQWSLIRQKLLQHPRKFKDTVAEAQWSGKLKIVQKIRFCLKIYHGLQFIHYRSTFVWKFFFFFFMKLASFGLFYLMNYKKILHIVVNTPCPGPTRPKPWFCISRRPFPIRLTWILVHQCPPVQILIFFFWNCSLNRIVKYGI